MKRRTLFSLFALLASLVVVGSGSAPAGADHGAQTGQLLEITAGAPGPPHAIFTGSNYGQSLFIRIEVRDSSRSCLTIFADCDPPTGTVLFYANGVEIGRSGHRVTGDNRSWFELRYCCLAAGTYTIQGFYFGAAPNHFSNGYSSHATHTVAKTGSTVSLFQSASTTNAGQAATFTASVSGTPGAGAPTGTVQFIDNGSPLGGPVAVSGGTAVKTQALSIGAHTIVAKYSGDGNYHPNENQVAHSVQKAQPTLTTAASPGGPVGTFVYDVARLSGGSSPTGTMTFRLYGPDDAACTGSSRAITQTISGNGDYRSDLLLPLAPGTYRWTANYSGDANNASAASPCNSPSESVAISTATPTITTRASAGGPVGTSVKDVAVVAGGYAPAGTVVFRLFSDITCTTQVFTSTNPLSGGTTATSGDFTPTAAGTYYWTAVYSGDANNNPATSPCNAPNESVVITKHSPTISTVASPGVLEGGPVHDKATLANGSNPTGTVRFRLFANSTCTTQVFTSTVAVTGATATSGHFTPAAVGTYFWTAAYSGDSHNNPATSPCNAPNESVVVRPFAPPPCTRTLTGDVFGPVTVNAGESVCLNNAKVQGPVTVSPGGALTVAGSQLAAGLAADNPAFLSLCGSQVVAPRANPDRGVSVSNAAVPLRIGDPAKGCAMNKIMGVTLTGNTAGLTMGANEVSGKVTVNNHSVGNVVPKANTISGVLGCAGNNPPPTNGGQPNAAFGGKTGQCAGL